MSGESLEGAVVGSTGTVVAEETVQTSEPTEEVKEVVEDSGEAESETEESEEKVEKPKKDKPELTKGEEALAKMQKRIGRVTAQGKREAEQRTMAENEVRRLTEELKQFQPKESNEVREEDFDTYDEYVEAMVNQRAESKISERDSKRKNDELQRAQQSESEQRRKVFDEKVHNFRIDTPDYPQAETAFGEIYNDINSKLGQDNKTLSAMDEIGLSSDHTAAIIYELGNTPELFEEIANMSVVDARREMYKLEASLSKRKPNKAKSKPDPITPVGAKGKFTKSPSEMTSAELLAWVNN